MRTADASSQISAGSVLTSLVVFATVYLFIFAAGAWYLWKLLKRGPQPVDDELLHPEHHRAKRPLSVPNDSLESPQS
jgi:cytochrome d ubiquinol oxidase subunit I